MTLKVTDNQYGLLSYRQLGFLLMLFYNLMINNIAFVCILKKIN